MEKKTHAAVAIASATIILNASTVKYKAINVLSSAIGGLISDIDLSTSETHKDVTIISVISFLSIIGVFLLDHFYDLGIIKLISKNFNIIKCLLGISIFGLICSHGLHTPHRTFMHSILASILLSICIFFVFKPATIPFFIGMISHIILDLLNKTRVQIFYPLDFKMCLNVCPSTGVISKIICFLALFITFLYI